ncbi:MAG: hypothetical protein K0R65_1052 [Crocinitomicaceae bacterium]|jgi:hypothetical protein|nr:hypothetical protein [Crocinitomicaceae bacterium]
MVGLNLTINLHKGKKLRHITNALEILFPQRLLNFNKKALKIVKIAYLCGVFFKR